LLGEIVHALPPVAAFSGKVTRFAVKKMLASTNDAAMAPAAGTTRRVIF
jgi:hypothetical protein